MNESIKAPNANDVIFGRGNAANHHPGNIRLRELIAVNKDKYDGAPNDQKQALISAVIEHIESQNPPGRYLMKCNGVWHRADEVKQRRKTAQAFRDSQKGDKSTDNTDIYRILVPMMDQHGTGEKYVDSPPIFPGITQAATEPRGIYNPDHDKSIDWKDVMGDNNVSICLGQSTLNTLTKSSACMDIDESNGINDSTQLQQNDTSFNAMDNSMNSLSIRDIRMNGVHVNAAATVSIDKNNAVQKIDLQSDKLIEKNVIAPPSYVQKQQITPPTSVYQATELNIDAQRSYTQSKSLDYGETFLNEKDDESDIQWSTCIATSNYSTQSHFSPTMDQIVSPKHCNKCCNDIIDEPSLTLPTDGGDESDVQWPAPVNYSEFCEDKNSAPLM